jgi:hypothetical protein
MSPFRTLFTASALATMLALGAVPAAAHHSFGFFDMNATSEISGVVSRWEWGNPHCWLFIEAMSGGKSTTYGFELRSPGELIRTGWKKTSVAVGDKIKVAYHPMRDGSPAGLMVRVTDANGKLIGRPLPLPAAPAAPAAAS